MCYIKIVFVLLIMYFILINCILIIKGMVIIWVKSVFVWWCMKWKKNLENVYFVYFNRVLWNLINVFVLKIFLVFNLNIFIRFKCNVFGN